MRKDRFYMVLFIVASVMAIALGAAYMASDHHRSAAVEDLKAKTAVVEQRMAKAVPPTSRETAPSKDPLPAPDKPDEAYRDSILAYEQFVNAKREADAAEQWWDTINLIYNENWGEWTDAEREKVAAYLEANRELILELRRLADGSEPLYVLDYGKGFSMELFHLPQFRSYARLLAADAAFAAARGDYEEVVRNYAAINNFAAMLTDEPILLSQLTRVAMMDTLYANAVQTLTGEDLSPEVLRHIIALASNVGGRDALADSLAGEAYFGLDAFEGLRNWDFDRAGWISEGSDTFLMRLYGSVLARPFLNLDEEAYARTITGLSDAIALPMYQSEPLLDQIYDEIASLPRTRVLSRTMLPTVTLIAEAYARYEARMGLMQVGLAVEHYHGQHGAYPETLDQVAPLLGNVMPTDPYTGHPFVYEPRGNGFTLYSARGNRYGPTAPLFGRQYANLQGHIVWRGAN